MLCRAASATGLAEATQFWTFDRFAGLPNSRRLFIFITTISRQRTVDAHRITQEQHSKGVASYSLRGTISDPLTSSRISRRCSCWSRTIVCGIVSMHGKANGIDIDVSGTLVARVVASK